jgi:hypothetical protein
LDKALSEAQRQVSTTDMAFDLVYNSAVEYRLKRQPTPELFSGVVQENIGAPFKPCDITKTLQALSPQGIGGPTSPAHEVETASGPEDGTGLCWGSLVQSPPEQGRGCRDFTTESAEILPYTEPTPPQLYRSLETNPTCRSLSKRLSSW